MLTAATVANFVLSRACRKAGVTFAVAVFACAPDSDRVDRTVTGIFGSDKDPGSDRDTGNAIDAQQKSAGRILMHCAAYSSSCRSITTQN